MTKVEAIKKVLEDNEGVATWTIIYNNIDKYYPNIKGQKDWQAGIRGVLYREIYKNKHFKQIGFGIISLIEFNEEKVENIENDPIRMHSYIEGICIELGNFEKQLTYTADPTAKYRDNVFLNQLIALETLPNFTYSEIVNVAKRIDVLWFNNKGFLFPKKAFEVVDSIGTLGEALNRTFQLNEFNLDFLIIGEEKNRNKFNDKVKREPYKQISNRYKYKSYDEIILFYNKKLELEKMSFFEK